jgi:hypothetical protein
VNHAPSGDVVKGRMALARWEAAMAADVHEILAPAPADPTEAVPSPRRRRLPLFVVLLLAVLVWAALPLDDPEQRLLVVHSESALTVMDAASGDLTARVARGVASPAWGRHGPVVVGVAGVSAADTETGTQTVLRAVDGATGAPRWQRRVPGELSIRLVGADGQTVVLGDAEGGIHQPRPRPRTRITVSRGDGTARTYDLVGNYEPEALSTDGTNLFVISYLPPLAPDRYQVRRLDLATGEVEGVYTPDEELQQEMGGTARTQTWAPDGSRLYTLYTLSTGEGIQAFVHVLDLDGMWAHCIDLPQDVGAVDERAVALATSAGGEWLYAADLAVGRLVEVDTATLQIRRSVDTPPQPSPTGDVLAAVPSGGRELVVSAGTHVRSVALSDLRSPVTWRAPAEVVGLQAVGRDVVAVLASRRAIVLGTARLEERRTFTVPGTDPIRSAGAAAPTTKAWSGDFPCAC